MVAKPIRDDLSPSDLRQAAKGERAGRVRARLLAIAACLERVGRGEAARLAGMSRNVLRIWIDRYNAAGLDGLRDKRRSGRPSEITARQRQRLRQRVLAGPDLERDGDGVTAFRIVDIQRIGREEFAIGASWSTIRRLLHAEKLSWLSPRPQHPAADEQAMEDFKKTSLPK